MASDTAVCREIGLRVSPAEAVARWPVDSALLALVSADDGNAWSRWSILAPALATNRRLALAPDPAAAWREVERSAARMERVDPDAPPFAGGWIGWIAYDAGFALESAAMGARVNREGNEEMGWLARCDAAYVHDGRSGRWWAVGSDETAVSRLPDLSGAAPASAGFETGPLEAVDGREAYERGVARVVAYIHAGDIFQANLAHRLRAPFRGSPRAAFVRMLQGAKPAFGALLEEPAGEDGRRAILSISPELFLDADLRSRRVVTRPIKGTRPLTMAGAEADLRASGKDAAELAMIVDLMRNDLGRVCDFGSVRVDEARTLEAAGGNSVLHGVATVSGTLRNRAGLADLLGATIPAGSITGAPKIRAMQIIDDLEGWRRGAYCGSIGFLSDCGVSRWSVAIRTATLEGRTLGEGAIDGALTYPVGAGIVAESLPEAEWAETLAKAEALCRGLGAPGIVS